MTRIALLCSGLGNIRRGHESFASGLFDLLKDDIDITLFKGAGGASAREVVVPNVPRNTSSLSAIKLPVSTKWLAAAQESERMRVEAESFAWGALGALLDGNFDVIHCLEQEVCTLLWQQRHLFRQTPRILWSNGGAIGAAHVPPCDFIQEHTEHNRLRSIRSKAFCIPHGVDTKVFRQGIVSDFRAAHGIPDDAFVVLSVGAIAATHKRMDHVVREVSSVPGAWLVVVGQEGDESAAIKALGARLMAGRVMFTSLPHTQLPSVYAAADVFVLASLFETFGIVFIEAMACGIPVVCSQHPNQREIVREGLFLDMSAPGALAHALTNTPPAVWRRLAEGGRRAVTEHYDLEVLKLRYLGEYARIAAAEPAPLPQNTLSRKLIANVKNAHRVLAGRFTLSRYISN